MDTLHKIIVTPEQLTLLGLLAHHSAVQRVDDLLWELLARDLVFLMSGAVTGVDAFMQSIHDRAIEAILMFMSDTVIKYEETAPENGAHLKLHLGTLRVLELCCNYLATMLPAARTREGVSDNDIVYIRCSLALVAALVYRHEPTQVCDLCCSPPVLYLLQHY